VVADRQIFFSRFLVLLFTVSMLGACSSGKHLEVWHTERLHEEFTAEQADEVKSLEDYLALEDRLFTQLQEEVYAQTETGPEFNLDRYSSGSAADPTGREPNWNRSYELIPENPLGGVLLLHGMSDGPYALRALGQSLYLQGFHVVGMRMPGHGTAPSGLRFIDVKDMVAAVEIGMRHLQSQLGDRPLYISGYSTGAPLALNYALDAYEVDSLAVPAGLILVSPAIRIHAVAGMASFKRSMSAVPGFGGMAYLQVEPEFDPYKYNSFATNAADVVHRLTRSVTRRVDARAKKYPDEVLPPILAFKSTVDVTVSTNAIVDNLLAKLAPDRHELVLFDINRFAAVRSRLLIDDPAPLTDRLVNSDDLPFTFTLITNENKESAQVVSRSKPPFTAELGQPLALNMAWPAGIISLSHVALPASPYDPLYGQRPPDNDDFLFLGQMALQGERGLLRISPDWMFRLRYNPFYDYLEQRALDWVAASSAD
jgi:alpha-beta hydrolase superfamily lysophospholipase